MHLDGVTDEWLKNLTVETVAGGQLSKGEDARLLRCACRQRFGEFLLSKENV